MYEYTEKESGKTWLALPHIRLTGNGNPEKDGMDQEDIKRIKAVYTDGCNGMSIRKLAVKIQNGRRFCQGDSP